MPRYRRAAQRQPPAPSRAPTTDLPETRAAGHLIPSGARSSRVFIHIDLHRPSSVIEFPARHGSHVAAIEPPRAGEPDGVQVSALRAGSPVGPAQAAGPGTAGHLPGAAR